MGVKYTNNAYSTLASGITDVGTSISVQAGHGARFPSIADVNEYFYCTLADSSNNLEIVKVTARSTDTLTVTRGAESTTARAYISGDRIELRVTAAGLTEFAAPFIKGSAIASAGTVTIPDGGAFFHITGTTTITDIDFTTPSNGRWAWVVFDGALTLTHNATTLILPGGASITTAANDRALFVQDATDNVYCLAYHKASGVNIISDSTKANLASPTFTGTVTIPTPFTLGAVSVLPTGTELNFVDGVTSNIQTQLDAKAALASPTFTGTPTLPTGTIATTQSAADSTTKVATTAFVTTADNLKANLASPTFTGTPAAPTASAGTDTTQLATTAFVTAAQKVLVGTSVQTGSYTLVLGDAGKLVEMNVAGANNLTVPLNSSVAYPVGTRIDFVQTGAGQTTVVPTGGVTIRSTGSKLKTFGQYSGASLVKCAADIWYLFGDITA